MSLEDKMKELETEYYFNLSRFKHKALFEDAVYVWDALKKLPNYVATNLRPEIKGQVDDKAVVGKDVYIGRGTIVEPYAIIKGPAIIGDNCVIQSKAYIRENVVIGDYTRVGDTEIKHSILLGGDGPKKKELSHLAHRNYIGNSIIGNKVILGAAVTTAALRGDWKEVPVYIEGKKYETGLAQLGAIIGDNTLIGCGITLNPGTLIGQNSRMYDIHHWRGFLPSDKIVKPINYELQYEIIARR